MYKANFKEVNMDFKINRETISASECIYEVVQEQGLELDYILPDYFPDVFKLVKCEAVPVVSDYSINGDKLSYELRCDIRILYCSESGSVLQCVNQKQTFSKTLDLGKYCENPVITLQPKTDYVNCRAVNKRRLDLRGAISIKIKVVGEKKQEVISDAFGLNVQMRKVPIKYAAKKVSARKLVQLSEDVELSSTQASVISIIRCRCMSISCEKKMISGKLLAKGEVSVQVMYSCEKDGSGGLEHMEFAIPYSQIIDLDGIDDTYECDVRAEAMLCDVTPVQGRDGESRMLKCESEIRLDCNAVKTAQIELGADAYSTTYPCSTAVSEIKAEQIPVKIIHTIHHSAKLYEGDDVPSKIYYMWCTPKNVNAVILSGENKLSLSGMLTYTMAAQDSTEMIIMPDKDEAFEEVIELDSENAGDSASAEITVSAVSYNISTDNVLTAKAEINAEISLFSSSSVKALSDIAVDGSVKKVRDGDYAIKLYYGTENEDVWEIAKRYSTSVDAIIEENELDSDKLSQSGMLIIPIVS